MTARAGSRCSTITPPGARSGQVLRLRGRRHQCGGPVGIDRLWYRDGDRWAVRKVITIPAEPADAAELPPALQPFGAVPPLAGGLGLTVDDRWLYVGCWGTGELKQYDVSDPFHPRETGSVRLGGIVHRKPHPAEPDLPLSGAPQMVEVSRDGRRVYVTNSLYGVWDDIFYPDGVGAWMAKLDADPTTERAASLPARSEWRLWAPACWLPSAERPT
jgi:56kDa selenium binding protein (SBP56)